MDCAGTLFHNQLVSEGPSDSDQQVSSHSAHDPVHANWAGTKRVLQGHDNQDGQAQYLQRRIPTPIAERRLEFDDQVRCCLRIVLFSKRQINGPPFREVAKGWAVTSLLRMRSDAQPSLMDASQEPLAARAACWLTICSFIFCCISLGVGSAMWVATIQV
jgi:hypothetical protein